MSKTTIEAGDDWRLKCPNGHSTITTTNNHWWCRTCANHWDVKVDSVEAVRDVRERL